jgi:hypothetical protein
MRVLVCGGRRYADPICIWKTLDQIARDRGCIRLIIDGASDDVTGPYIGADYWANQWALARGIPTVRCHAEWKQHGKAAGPIRNRKMRDEYKPDLVVAFPGGHGTEGMVALAEEGGIEVIRL